MLFIYAIYNRSVLYIYNNNYFLQIKKNVEHKYYYHS